jgi:hypothetical protein
MDSVDEMYMKRLNCEGIEVPDRRLVLFWQII